MKILLKRIHKTKHGTSGFLNIDGEFHCYTLELPDKENAQRISCIPIGRYTLIEREEVTDMTTRYRRKYDWFNWHLMLKDVKNRSGIYLHIGNITKDSYGCILLGSQINSDHFLSNSTKTFKKFYMKIKAAIRRGEKVQITIE